MSNDQPIGLFWRDWTLHKAGNRSEENEDASLVQPRPGAHGPEGLLIAVADGASEAVYAGPWARTLVAAAERDWPTLSDEELSERLAQVGQAFSPIDPEAEIPWYVRNKFLAQGSQATLLVVALTASADTDRFSVRAVSVGDCCLLLFKEDGEIHTFPLHTAGDFGLNPALVRNRRQPALDFDRWETQMQPGDLLLACTDAVGKWILQCLESNQAGLLFEVLLELLTPATPESSPSLEASSGADTSLPQSESMPAEGHPATKDDVEHLPKLRRLWRLVQRPRPEPSPAEPPETETPTSDEPATPEPRAAPSLDFEEFIARYRASGSRPRMRNDDSTLVMCLPVRSAGNDRQSEVLETLRGYQAAIARSS